MKIALVHELLTMRGGAERVLRVLANHFPEAPIYTLLYNEKKLGAWFPKERVRTSNVYSAWKGFNHHRYLKQFPSAVEAWDFSEFDVVISSSSAFAHGILTNGKPKHISYIHSPARYLWDRTHDVQERAKEGMFGALKKRYLSSAFHNLRVWDSEVADRADLLLAASKEVQRRTELYWRRPSTVVYPPIGNAWFGPIPPKQSPEEYYLVASTLVRYKRIDIAIQACNALQKKLKIVGEGPDKKRLQSLAGPTIEFCGYQTDGALKELFCNARAVLFPGLEDFGLVPLEALACGTPVIAFHGGGALETLTEGVTGEFFQDPTAESLGEAMKRFETKTYNPKILQDRAAQFSEAVFLQNIDAAVQHVLNS